MYYSAISPVFDSFPARVITHDRLSRQPFDTESLFFQQRRQQPRGMIVQFLSVDSDK